MTPHGPIVLWGVFLVLDLAACNRNKNYFNIWRILIVGWVQVGECHVGRELQTYVLQFILVSVEIGLENLALVSFKLVWEMK